MPDVFISLELDDHLNQIYFIGAYRDDVALASVLSVFRRALPWVSSSNIFSAELT